MSRRGLPASRRRVEVPNSLLHNPCPGRESRFCAILGRLFRGLGWFRWGGRPILGCSTTSGQLLEAAATGDVGADRRLRRRAAVQNSPPESEKRPESVGVSPPLRGDFMGSAAFGGAL